MIIVPFPIGLLGPFIGAAVGPSGKGAAAGIEGVGAAPWAGRQQETGGSW